MTFTPYTRRIEECRKRWHHRTVQYVLQVARIIRAARRAAKDERRWGRWIRTKIHMNRTTVYRYLRVAEFLKSNVDLSQQLVSLSIVKIYALSRLRKGQASALIRSGKARRMNDVAFLRTIARIQGKSVTHATRPNLLKSVDAALGRLERSIVRWQHSDVFMPTDLQLRLQTRLHHLEKVLARIRKTSAAAM